MEFMSEVGKFGHNSFDHDSLENLENLRMTSEKVNYNENNYNDLMVIAKYNMINTFDVLNITIKILRGINSERDNSLTIACKCNNNEIANLIYNNDGHRHLLLEENEEGNTPLYYICKNKMLKLFKIIIEDDESKKKIGMLDYIDFEKVNKKGETLLMMLSKEKLNYYAIKILDYTYIEEDKNFNFDYVDNNGKTSLMYSVENDSYELFLKIVDKSKIKHEELLIMLCKNKYSDFGLKILDDEKFTFDFYYTDNKNKTAFDYSSKNGLSELSVKIIEKLRLNQEEKITKLNDETTLIFLIKNKLGSYGINLIKKKYNLNIDYVDKEGMNALMYAITNKLTELAKKLINLTKNINQENSDNETALFMACKKDSTDLVLKLLSFPNIDVTKITKRRNETCLIRAVKNDNEKVVSKMLKNKKISEIIEIRDDCDEDVLSASVTNVNDTMFQELIKKWEGDFKKVYKDVGNTTLLQRAEYFNMGNACHKILDKEKYCNLENKDLIGNTFLINILKKNKDEITERDLLIEKIISRDDINIHCENKDGEDALSIGINNLEFDMFKKIINLWKSDFRRVYKDDGCTFIQKLYNKNKKEYYDECKKILKSKKYCFLSNLNNQHKTLLMNSIEDKYIEIAELILKIDNQDIGINKVDISNSNAFLYSAYKNLPKISNMIIDRGGFDTNLINVHGHNSIGYLFCHRNELTIIKIMEKYYEEIKHEFKNICILAKKCGCKILEDYLKKKFCIVVEEYTKNNIKHIHIKKYEENSENKKEIE